MRVKELYLAKTLEELNIKASTRSLSGEDPKKLINAAGKLLDQASVMELKDKDEEQEYVYLMKFFECYKTVKTSKLSSGDKDHLKLITGKKTMSDIMTRLEQLSKSLQKRYDLKNEVVKLDKEKEEADKNEAAVNTKVNTKVEENKKLKPSMNGVTMKFVDTEVVNSDDGDMTVSQLKNLMDQKSTPILIIDCRAASDFTSAHVNHPDCISIPSEILEAGITANKITNCLKNAYPESYHLWNKRGVFEKIILYDWNSSVCHQSSNSIQYLLKAMNQWDIGTTYKSKPFILQGGIRNVYFSYPMLINQPLNVKNGEQSEAIDQLQNSVTKLKIDTISYPDLDEEEAKPKKLTNFTDNPLQPPSRSNTLNGPTIVPLAAAPMQTFDRNTKPLTKSKIPPSSLNGYPTSTSNQAIIQNGTNLGDDALPILKNEQLEPSRSEPDPSVLPNGTSFLYSNNNISSASHTNVSSLSQIPEVNSSMKNLSNGFVTGIGIGEPNNIPNATTSLSAGTKMPNGGEDTAQSRSISAGLSNTKNNNILEKGRQVNGDSASSNSLTMIKNDVGSSSPKIARPAIPDPRTKPTRIRTNTSPGLDQPATPSSPDSPSFSITKLKDDNFDSPRSSLLKRSHSNPNISQLSGEILDEDENSLPKPVFNRNLKPLNNRIPERESYYRRRDFQVVSSTDKSETGLKNLGNTCYMNSIMQCINHTVPLVEYFRSLEFRGELTKKRGPSRGEVTEEVGKSIIEMNKGHRSISLFGLKTAFGKFNKSFGSSEQQDSHEFLTFLLDHLHEELNKCTKQPFKEQKNDGLSDSEAAENAWNYYLESNNSIITELFCGQQKSSVRCLNCQKSSTTFDTFFVLSIPIPETRIPGKRYSIQECLDLYTAEEEINDWGCANCKVNGRAKKKIDLWRLPPTLIIHFQRFYVDSYCKKRLTEIDFPVDILDLNRFMKGHRKYPFMYQLYGTSNHYGTMDSGHYTAYCRRNKSWAKFDDQEVCGILTQNVSTSAAYILFYSQVDTP